LNGTGGRDRVAGLKIAGDVKGIIARPSTNRETGKMRNIVIICATLICSSSVIAKDSIKIEPDKETIIEAVDYSKQTGHDVHTWKKIKSERKDVPAHILASPDNNTVYDLTKKYFEQRSPSVSYAVKFVKEGTYYVWIRGLGVAGGASVAVGYDGVLLKSRYVGFFGAKWGWLGSFSDGDRIEITVEKPGEHTLGLWIVEDGVAIEKLLIVADPKHDPNKP
jgi:hypothetical protein